MTAQRGNHRRAKRVLAGAAFVSLFVFLGAVAIAWIERENEIAQDKADLQADQALQGREPALQMELAALRARAQSAPGLLEGASAALAQAELADQMKGLIDAHNGVLMSAQMLPPDKRSHFDEVAVAYDMTIPLSRLKSFLYAVEAHTPYFFLDEADVQMPANWRPEAAQTPDPLLEIRCMVHAFHWGAG